ncbi:endonuclease MutS2 [uncultured Thermosynechococcus sp.]|uniref:endonuclease MutS2 n=1 Tax=uncultured Thermosynechococcus sp. TaxID=436945 RepID=UPI0026368660|nr:endonuclease MutS2 [uncultured Thermosynechococcus sp.]
MVVTASQISAFDKSLGRLEWPRLCQQLATFASTKRGMRQLQSGEILAGTPAASQVLLAQTAEVIALETVHQVRLDFSQVTDLEPALERLDHRGCLQGSELLAIAHLLSAGRQQRRQIEEHGQLQELQRLVAGVRTYPEVAQEIYRCITDQGQVSDRASPELAQIRQQQRQCRAQIQQHLQQILQQRTSAIQEAVVTQRRDRYVLAVKATHKDQIPGIVHDLSASGATLYIEPQETVELQNRLQQLVHQEAEAERAICQALSDQLATISDDLWYLLDVLTSLDMAVARARYSLWLQGNPPQFVSETRLHLKALRHPLLVWQEQHEQGQRVVPIDLELQPPTKVVTITGPNTGGKTATLKTLGLAALMARAGLYVPAAAPAELPWFTGIWADIGDEQSLTQNLSTFSSHICNIRDILAELEVTGGKTLVLLDEIGAGTDPSEGTALAIALLRYLADHASLTFATTHYGELKALKYQDSRFENAAVEFDEQTLAPTYRLLWGIPGQSNALAIAQRLGLYPSIIEEAKACLSSESNSVNEMILGLVSQRQAQEAKTTAAAALLRDTEALYQEIAGQAQQLRQRQQQLRQQQEEQVRTALHEAQREIAKVIAQLQRANSPEQVQAAQAALHQIEKTYLPPPPPVGFIPQPGDRVRLPQWQQVGEVLSVSRQGDLVIQVGNVKFTVPPHAVESLQGEPVHLPSKPSQQKPCPDSSPRPATPQVPAIRTESRTLDLRGKRTHEAEPLLEEFLNRQEGTVWIIHGHGSGALRRFVHQFLDQHPSVQNYTLAPPEEGGRGVTIVQL